MRGKDTLKEKQKQTRKIQGWWPCQKNAAPWQFLQWPANCNGKLTFKNLDVNYMSHPDCLMLSSCHVNSSVLIWWVDLSTIEGGLGKGCRASGASLSREDSHGTIQRRVLPHSPCTDVLIISFLRRVVASAIWPCSSVLGWKRSLLGDTESRLQITSAYIPKSGCSMVSGY